MSEETATKTRLRVGPAGRRRGDAPRKPGAKLAMSSAGTACRGAKRNHRNREEGSREVLVRLPAAGDQS